MPHDKSVTTFMPENLLVAMDQIAAIKGKSLAETQHEALVGFIELWKAGKTSRRYFGRYPDSQHKTVWVSKEVREDLAKIRDADGVGLSEVIQEAFCWYCEKMGFKVEMSMPVEQALKKKR
jgi:hypothetical protein